jgi:REP element-mobilizing transposase RayT
MPNHFHFLIRIKEEKEVESVILKKTRKSSKTLQGFQTLEGLAKWQAISSYLSQQFSHFFNGYTQAFNKQQNRKGNLFMHTFKRKQITDEAYLRKLIHYIHYNPMASGLAQSLENWKYSSYKTIVSKGKTKLQREEAILFFNDIENFIYCHREPPNITGI